MELPREKADELATTGQHVGAAMIAHCTEHPGLQISIGHVVGKAADV
jgi:hypothetical protein